MTTRGLSRKQVIVLMKHINMSNFVKDLSMHMFNINHILKNIKSSMMADYIHTDGKGIIITTNNIASSSDLQAVKKYVKSASCINSDQVQSPRLPQSKSYLKIIGVPYLPEATNSHISSDEVKRILKNNHIFNDIVLASKPRIVKISSKLDMAIIWIDI